MEGVAFPAAVSLDHSAADEGEWHARTCHVSQDRVRQAAKVTQGMKVTSGGLQKTCTACVEGKLKRRPFPPSTHRATGKLDEVHVDLIGKMPLQSRNKKWHAVVVVDGFSRFSWVFCIYGKSDAVDVLMKWMAQAERHSQCKLKFMRLDGGTEFIGQDFVQSLEEQGVIFRTTVPATPQQNGVVERVNGILVEMARAALHGAGLPLYWWEYALKYANWVRNRLPSKANNQRTPFELWKGEMPSLAMARPFGCMAHYWLPKQGEQGGSQGRKKWDPKARWGMFVGIPEDTKGWTLWDPELDRFRTSCTVVFHEHLFYRQWKQQDVRRGHCVDFPDAPWPDQEEFMEGPEEHNDAAGVLQDTAAEEEDPIEEYRDEVSHGFGGPDHPDLLAPDSRDDGEGEFLPPEPQVYSRRRRRVEFEEPAIDEDTRPVVRQRLHSPPSGDMQAAHDDITVPLDVSSLPHVPSDRREAALTTAARRPRMLIVQAAWAAITLMSTVGQWVYALAALPEVPRSLRQAMRGPDAMGWKAAADKEYQALVDRGTWTLVPRPKNRKIISTKWVFTVKTKPDGSFDRFKGRLVARGFDQRLGLDFGDTYAPVGRYTTARLLLAIACAMDWDAHVMDVTNAFLYGDIDHEIYMEQPEGYSDGTDKVCHIQHALYGLKQSPRQWNLRLHEYLVSLGFQCSDFDPALYLRFSPGGGVTYLLVYVDDILIIASHSQLLSDVKHSLSSVWQMKDIGEVQYYLGLNVKRDRKRRLLWIGQPKYIAGLLNRYDFEEASPSTPLTSGFKHLLPGELADKGKDAALSPLLDKKGQRLYQSIIGALNFAAGCSRPDIAYAVSKLASVNHCPRERHLPQAVRCMQYLVSTAEVSLTFRGDHGKDSLTLRGASDADWAGCPVTGKSTTGFIFALAGGPVSWLSKRQIESSLSSCQAEYVALTWATKECKWLRDILSELGFRRDNPTPMMVDNAAAVELSKYPKFHTRTKHVQLAFKYAREEQEKGTIQVLQVPTTQQPADFLTKNVPAPILASCMQYVGMSYPN